MYRLEIKRSVVKEIKRLRIRDRQRINAAIRTLADEPRPDGCKRLKSTHLFSLRVGDYRIIYEIQDDQLIVLVLRVRHRREVYRNL